ncbi:hypothetical protein N7463_003886 [Penicillium fimorum]|uniref:NADP-dependent oxidoreductase domain-containing protein n=1 Tax=Penicillium fimorum TaxID=1882269 RepID=A0A9W9Y3H4_9EURO|nr:hypothetical protein N7463_003886 [Penicillium fimorum]
MGRQNNLNYNPTRDLPRIHTAWVKLKSAWLTFVDTAQSYECERVCKALFRDMPRDLLAGPSPSFKLQDSLLRLRLDYVDIYLVHGPIHPSKISTATKGMADCVASGIARAVGVANYDTKEMIKMADELANRCFPTVPLYSIATILQQG